MRIERETLTLRCRLIAGALSAIALVAVSVLDNPTRALFADQEPRAAGSDGAITISMDSSEAPELADWGEKAKSLAEAWYPKECALLVNDDFVPPRSVKLILRKDMKGVAATGGTTIHIAAEYVKAHPDDLGMVVHELAHVVQSYPKGDPGWLVEGIADYIRFFHYEPEARLGRIDPARQSYRDGYRTSAAFLGWIVATHDPELVRKLNRALRRNEYKHDLFKEYTGKSLDRLWADFLDDKASLGR